MAKGDLASGVAAGPMVAPLFECSAELYRLQPVLTLSAALAATSSGKLVRLKAGTLRDLTEALGFRPLDQTLDGDRPNRPALVAGGRSGVTLEVDGKSPLVLVVAMPSQEWLRAASAIGTVHVVFAVPPRFRRFELRRALASGRAFGGPVPMVAVDIEEWQARYSFLGRTRAELPLPQGRTVMLDACVAVDLERAARGVADGRTAAQVRCLVLQLIHMDVVPGGAIAELVTDPIRRRYDGDRAHRLSAAVDAWFDGGAARASSPSEVRDAYRAALARPPSVELPAAYEPDPRQCLHYACLLKLACLWADARGGYRALQRVDLYAEFVSWMTHDLGLVDGYALQVARDRLIGPQGHAARYTDLLLKLSKRRLRDLWGASWDLHHLSMVDIVQDGGLLDIAHREVMLVTADRGLVRMRERIHDSTVRADTQRGRLPYKFGKFEVDPRLGQHVERIKAIHEEMNTVVFERAMAGADMPTLEHILAEIDRLEPLAEEL